MNRRLAFRDLPGLFIRRYLQDVRPGALGPALQVLLHDRRLPLGPSAHAGEIIDATFVELRVSPGHDTDGAPCLVLEPADPGVGAAIVAHCAELERAAARAHR